MAEISVIVPVYRVENFLDRCVQSVLHQSFQNFELILVDDGSPDRCPVLCDGYAQQDKRVHVIHRENGGLSAARNSGIDWVMQNSCSQWITFLDSDDWLHRETLERQLKAAADTDVSLVLGGYARVAQMQKDPELEKMEPLVLDSETAYSEHYIMCMSAWCKLIRRELLENLRFPEGKLHEDCFVTHRWLFEAGRAALLEQPLYYYYCNPDSITRKRWNSKRLEDLQAHQTRLQYLRDHGYERAVRAELRIYIETVYEHVETLAFQGGPESREYLEPLRKHLRSLLKKEKELVPLDAETIWIYLMAWHTAPIWHLGKKLQSWYHRMKGTQ